MQNQIGYDPLTIGGNIGFELKNKAIKSFIWSSSIVGFSFLFGIFLKDIPISIDYSYLISISLLILGLFNFGFIVYLEQYRKVIGRLTIPSLAISELIIFTFVLIESFNEYIPHVDYNYITPFILLAVILTYIAVFKEKKRFLKIYLGLNTIGLLLLWSMAIIDKVVMPF